MEKRNRIKVVLAEESVKSKFIVDELGVSKTTVSRWVNNKQQPTLEHLFSIAELLNVNICSLLIQNELNQESPDSNETNED